METPKVIKAVPLRLLIESFERHLPGGKIWCDMFGDLVHYSELTQRKSICSSGKSWTDSTDGGGWTNVLLHRTLAWRPLAGGYLLSERVPEESMRIATLLYLAVLWRKFGVYPVRTGDLTTRLMYLRLQQSRGWDLFWALEAWVLVMGAIESDELERQYFVSEIIGLADKLDMTAVELLEHTKGILWLEDAFGDAGTALQEELLEL